MSSAEPPDGTSASTSSIKEHGTHQSMPVLLAERRPVAVAAAVEMHQKDAAAFGPRSHGLSPLVWERDAASNYLFGGFGDGSQAMSATMRRVRDAGRSTVSILDVGCGAGTWLLAAVASCPADMRISACGLTGGREAHDLEAMATCAVSVSEHEDWTLLSDADRDTGDDVLPANVRILHRFPIESVLSCGSFAGVNNGSPPPKFDLIVCSWTLRHCADPLGTIEQLCNLLCLGGILLANQIWLPFEGNSGQWDDLGAFREAINALSEPSCQSGVSVELAIEGDETRNLKGVGAVEDSGKGYVTALRCTRLTASTPVRFSHVEFTGEVSGPMSLDAEQSANVSLMGGPSYAVARYRFAPNLSTAQQANA